MHRFPFHNFLPFIPTHNLRSSNALFFAFPLFFFSCLQLFFLNFYLERELCSIHNVYHFFLSSRPDTSLLWFLTPFKAIKHLICNQYKWLAIKIVTALLLLAMLALFLYSMPGYMVKKMLGAWCVAADSSAEGSSTFTCQMGSNALAFCFLSLHSFQFKGCGLTLAIS